MAPTRALLLLFPDIPANCDAQFGGLVGIHFDDQRFDINLGAARIELVDDRAQVAVDRFAGGDDQRVGGRVGLDESGRLRRSTAIVVRKSVEENDDGDDRPDVDEEPDGDAELDNDDEPGSLG